MEPVVQKVNDLLKAGEPGNISVDPHSGYSGYEPQAVIDAMNEVLFGSWGFDEVSSEIVPGDKGALAIAQVRVWLKEIDFKPTAWGQNRVTRGDLGDARKGAQTDAIKKALSYFSIGNRAYHGLLDAKAPKAHSNGHGTVAERKADIDAIPTPAQLRARCAAIGMNYSEAVKFLFKRDVPDDALSPDMCATFDVALKKKEQASTAGAGR